MNATDPLLNQPASKIPHARGKCGLTDIGGKMTDFPESEWNKVNDIFWNKAIIKGLNDCWIWQGSISSAGYGQVRICGKLHSAHRIAWMLTNGAIPKGFGPHGTCVCHKCDVRLCVNPTHMFLGTNLDNSRDRHKKGRSSKRNGEQNTNAKLTEEDIIEIYRRLALGEFQWVIARDFKINSRTISKINTGKRWSHMKEAANGTR